MDRRSFWVGTLGCGVLACAGPDADLEAPPIESAQQAIANGAVDRPVSPARAEHGDVVVAVSGAGVDPTGTSLVGSGVLISPGLVLTAAHTRIAIGDTRSTIWLGVEGLVRPSAKERSVALYSGVNPRAPGQIPAEMDVALIRLDEKGIAATSKQFSRRPSMVRPRAGAVLEYAGFGNGRPRLISAASRPRSPSSTRPRVLIYSAFGASALPTCRAVTAAARCFAASTARSASRSD